MAAELTVEWRGNPCSAPPATAFHRWLHRPPSLSYLPGLECSAVSSLHLTARNNVSSHSTSPSRITQQTEWPQLVSIKEQKEQEEGGREIGREGGGR